MDRYCNFYGEIASEGICCRYIWTARRIEWLVSVGEDSLYEDLSQSYTGADRICGAGWDGGTGKCGSSSSSSRSSSQTVDLDFHFDLAKDPVM